MGEIPREWQKVRGKEGKSGERGKGEAPRRSPASSSAGPAPAALRKPAKLRPPAIPQEPNERGILRPIRPASPEELAQAIEALEPYHCSYPEGRVLSRQTGLPCRCKKLKGWHRCKQHKGGQRPGLLNTNFKTGRYSKHIPEGLISRFKRAMGEEDFLSSKEEIAAMTLRIGLLWERLEGGGGPEAWRRLQAAYAEMQAASKTNNLAGMKAAIEQIGELAQGANEAEAAWGELGKAAELRAKLSEKEWKRQRDLKQVLSMQQAMDLIEAVIGCITRHVPERNTLAAIQREINLLLISPGAIEEPLPGSMAGAIIESPARGK